MPAGLRNTYWASALFAILSVGALAAITVPAHSGAFWPFAIGRAAEVATPILHDESLPLLKAAGNPDPSPADDIDVLTSGGIALLPTGGPEGTAAVYREQGTQGGRISVYEVREGDTLSGIADMFGVSINTIVWANDIKGKTINPGMKLTILPITGLRYEVKNGGTVRDVAKKFDVDADEVAAFNGLSVDSSLAKGQELIIPGATLSAPKSSGPVSRATTPARTLPSVSGFFGNPVPGARLTQGIHGYNGIDLGAACGTPVYASAPGTVLIAKGNNAYNGGYGNHVAIVHNTHPAGAQTLYAHLTSVAASVGSSVEKGEMIGTVGNTGRSYGCHLHFEVRGAANPFAR